MVTDILAEHHAWTQTGDVRNPTGPTAQQRAEDFTTRLDVMFERAAILSMKETYTGESLKFLRTSTIVTLRDRKVHVGLGDFGDPAVKETIWRTLGHAQVLVRAIKVRMKLYRPPLFVGHDLQPCISGCRHLCARSD